MADAGRLSLSWLLATCGLWCLASPFACATNAPAYEATTPSASAEPAAKPDGARMRIPPIGVWGSIAYDLRRETSDAHDPVLQQIMTAKIDAGSYIYQPWFATVNGGLGLSMGWFEGSDLGVPGRDRFATGHGQINVFPQSRFPFEAHFNVSDTRTDGNGELIAPSRGITVGASQSYRPEAGPYVLSGSIEHASQDNGPLGHDSQDRMTFSADTRWQSHTVVVNGTYEHNTRERSAQRLDFGSIVARHNYLPSPELSVESIANATRNDLRGPAGSDVANIFQVSSLGYWRPLRQPYTATSSVRMLVSESTAGATIRNANVAFGGTYDVTPRLRLNALVSGGVIDTGKDVEALHGEAIGASYQGASVPLGKFRYDWNASANASYTGATTHRDGQVNVASANVGAGHSVSRTFDIRDGSAIGLILGQSLDGSYTTAADDPFGATGRTARLGTTASVTWSKGTGGVSAYARLAATDSRDLSHRDDLQMANAQVSGTWQISRASTLTGDLTAQWLRTRVALRPSTLRDDLPTETRTTTLGLSGNITYRHQRVFNVPRLRFTSEFHATDDSAVQQDALSLLPDRVTRSWENRLDYLIGRLATSLTFRIFEVNQRRNTLAMFRVQRDFAGLAEW